MALVRGRGLEDSRIVVERSDVDAVKGNEV
jgi:hypothetical protein